MKFKIILSCIVFSFISHNAFADIRIFACEPEWASLAKEIGGDKVTVYQATTGLQDPHHIQARPSLIAKLRRSDLLFCTGAELEIGWLPVLMQKSGNQKIQQGNKGYFMATDFVTLLEKPLNVDRSMGDVHSAGNPHIQMGPYNILKVADALGKRLGTIDENNAAYYAEHSSDFQQRWKAAIQKWEQQAASIKGNAYAVYHDSWIYLADWLHIDMHTAMEPKPGIPPSTEYLVSLLNKVKQKHVKKALYAAYQSSKAANWLGDKAGIPVVKLPFTVGGTPEADNLFHLYDQTIQLLVN